jgi:hypothetical protein
VEFIFCRFNAVLGYRHAASTVPVGFTVAGKEMEIQF